MRASTGVRESQQNRYGDPVALGRTKLGRRQPQRDEDSFADQQQAQPDAELESYLQALAPEDAGPAETTSTGGRPFGSSEVYQLRLPLMANERLKELAAKQGTSPGALARDWVMQHLSDGQGDPGGQPVPDGALAGAAMAGDQPPAPGPQQFGPDPGPQQFGGRDQFEQPPAPPADQQTYNPYGDPYANAYGPDPYGQDPYGQDPYGQDPYGGDPYAADPYAADPYAGAAQGPGTDQQFPAEQQFPGAPQNNPYAGGMPPGMPGPGPAAGPTAEQPPGLGTQVLNGPPGPDAPSQPPAAGTQMLTPAGAPPAAPAGPSPDASTQLIGADQGGPMPADQPPEQFPSNDFPANQLPGQPPAAPGPGGNPAWPQEAPQAPQGSQPPPRARNPYVAGGPPPAPQQPQQYGNPPFPTADAEITVPGNGQYY